MFSRFKISSERNNNSSRGLIRNNSAGENKNTGKHKKGRAFYNFRRRNALSTSAFASRSLVGLVSQLQLTGHAATQLHLLPKSFNAHLDQVFDGVPRLILSLRQAVLSGCPNALADAISAAHQKLVENLGGSEALPQQVAERLRKNREAFVSLGGPIWVCGAFGPMFCGAVVNRQAAESDSTYANSRRTEMLNEAMNLLRELCFSHPSLAEQPCGSKEIIVFWFSLLRHSATFDNAVGLIEEVLAVNSKTFCLSNVPNLHSLLRGFSCRQLALFCRVLALLVFEPEDRQLVESSKVLRSLELLQLRRDRVARANSTIDRNQATILGMPDMLPRLVKLLRFMNYSPPLARLSTAQMMANFPPTLDVLLMLRGTNDHEDWDFLDSLDEIVRRSRERALRDLSEHCDVNFRAGADGIDDVGMHSNSVAGAVESFMELLGPIQDTLQNPGQGATAGPDFTRLMEAINAAQNSRLIPPSVYTPMGATVTTWRSHDHDEALPTAPATRPPRGMGFRTLHQHMRTPQEASNELQFNAILLLPHQVEVLFVLCTLLGGRRKADVQDQLAELGLVEALDDMFLRLSWDAPPHTGPNPLERIHGPGCECNPESALRVQYLRLIHNFCDRDCDNNLHKNLMLSSEEQVMIASGVGHTGKARKGLLSKIVTELMREPSDSLYKFWLASCVEAYLRGSSMKEQMFVAHSGLMLHLLKEIFSEGLRCTGSLQTAFDLLGELSKGNNKILELLEASLSDVEVEKLMNIVTDNLVDSNVFVRSLVLTVDHTALAFKNNSPVEAWRGGKNPSYLMHSWCEVQALPAFFGNGGKSTPAMSTNSIEGSRGKKLKGEVHQEVGEPDLSSPASSPSTLISLMHIDELSSCRTLGPLNLYSGESRPFSGLEGTTRAHDSMFCWKRWTVPASLSRIEHNLSLKLPGFIRNLMAEVDLEGINHENICCLNTVIVILIFAYRRLQLAELLSAIRQSTPLKFDEPPSVFGGDEVRWEECSSGTSRHAQGPVASGTDHTECGMHVGGYSPGHNLKEGKGKGRSASGTEVLANFRKLLWFWREYYIHRGRDRLSLEFSSHVRFAEWKHVVDLLCADDGSAFALTSEPPITPRSAYSKMPRPPQPTSSKNYHIHG